MRVGVAVRTSAVVLASVATLGLALRAEPPTGATSLAIAGRSNATPWVASDGPLVAVVWGASIADKTDVFLAVSHDSGQTFGAARPGQHDPRRGTARWRASAARGGDGRTRIPSTAEVVVLWTARGAATSIKTARSRDGGRTFEPPVELQGADAAGDRGWPSLALDGRGTAHAIWLDHRGLAAARVAGASRDHKSGAAHDGVAMAQKSGLYYAAGTGTTGRARAGQGRLLLLQDGTGRRAPIRRCMPRGGTCTRATSGTSPSRSRATEADRLPSPFE